MPSTRSYVVITSQAICYDGGPISIEHFCDGTHFKLLEDAKRHGFETRGSDDFNIGVVEGRKLVDMFWMDKSIGEDLTTLARIEKEIGL